MERHCHTSNFTLAAEEAGLPELVLGFTVGRGRAFNIAFLDKGCLSEITEWLGRANVTVARWDDESSGNDKVRVMMDLDKADIAASPIWNNTSSQLELCIRAQLGYCQDTVFEAIRQM